MEYKEIGGRIKARRVELDISAATLAERLAMSKATIHRYENGDIRNIKLPVVESIARELRVNALWLIGKSDQKEDGDTEDFLVMLDKVIECARASSCLVANGKQVTKDQQRTIVTGLCFVKDYIMKI